MVFDSKRPWFVSGLAALAILGLGGPRSAEAQLKVAVRARSQPHDAVAAKLSPDLQATVAAEATFLGTAENGDAILDIPGTVTIEGAQEALAAAPVTRIDLVVGEQRYDRINELVVMYGGDRPPQGDTLEGLTIVDRHAPGRFVVVRSEDGLSAEEIQKIAGNAAVLYVEPNYVYRLLETPPPNDPRFVGDQLWGMKNINAKAAWAKVKSSPVTVAVIDTGIDYTHEDLKDNMWKNPGESGGGKETNGLDDDGDGFKDNVFGADFFNNDGDPKDGHSHGTHCAGTIAGVGNNGKGVVGVTWKLKLMAVQIFSTSGSFAGEAQVVKAIDFAVAKGAKVLSNSWGGGSFSVAIRDAITRAQSKGVLFVAAAGNTAGNDNDVNPFYPASYTNANIISVLAIDKTDKLASFSCFGKVSVDLGAPGVAIVSSVPGGYGTKSGTSMACPHVSGAAALVWGHPSYTGASYSTVKKLLMTNARPLADLSGKCVTGGTLNIKFLGTSTSESEVAAAGGERR